MGGGTLTIDGESYPFSIVGLGFGGFGASVVEKGIEAGADAVEDGIGTIKGWMKKDGD